MPDELSHPVVRNARPLTGRSVLVMFVAFFGVIAAVNAVMMTLAIRTMPGLDVKNGYVASQAMNGEIEAARQQAERRWSANVAVSLDQGRAPVSLELTDRDGLPVTGLDVQARLAHPAITRADHVAALAEIRPGLYAASIPQASAGAWTIVMEANRGGERVFASRNRVVLKDARP